MTLWFVNIGFLLLTAVDSQDTSGCGANNIICRTSTTYQYCFTTGTTITYAPSDSVLTCATGRVCSEAADTYACIAEETTTIETTVTTTVATVTAPATCTTAATYPAENCNQYYECLLVMWWYELVVQTCPTGQFFNTTAATCAANSTCYV